MKKKLKNIIQGLQNFFVSVKWLLIGLLKESKLISTENEKEADFIA